MWELDKRPKPFAFKGGRSFVKGGDFFGSFSFVEKKTEKLSIKGKRKVWQERGSLLVEKERKFDSKEKGTGAVLIS